MLYKCARPKPLKELLKPTYQDVTSVSNSYFEMQCKYDRNHFCKLQL